MDGFSTSRSGVLLIGATNRKEVLDPALLRSGRFDRIVRMGLPDAAGRLSTLRVHAEGKIIPRDADSVSEDFPDGDALLRTAALLTRGYSGADLANMLNEAAILAVRRNKAAVEMSEIETAMEKLKIGLPRAPLEPSTYKRQLAYIYAGRAALQTDRPDLLPDVLQISIAPRGSSVARIDSLPSEREWGRPGAEAAVRWDDAVARLAVLLAGRATEEIVFGPEAASTHTAAEVEEATQQAVELVGRSGLYREPGAPPFHLLPLPEEELLAWPGAVAEGLDEGVRRTMDEAFRRAQHAVRTLRPAIDALAAELEASETVYGARVRALVRDSPRCPQPIAAFADAAPDCAPAHAPGAAGFADGPGRVGVASFSRGAFAGWAAASMLLRAMPLPPAPPSMGLAGFALARGPGAVGLALFHGWVIDVRLSEQLQALRAPEKAAEEATADDGAPSAGAEEAAADNGQPAAGAGAHVAETAEAEARAEEAHAVGEAAAGEEEARVQTEAS